MIFVVGEKMEECVVICVCVCVIWSRSPPAREFSIYMNELRSGNIAVYLSRDITSTENEGSPLHLLLLLQSYQPLHLLLGVRYTRYIQGSN